MVAGEEAKVEPLAEFGPSFGFKLGLGIGGDDSAGVGECAELRDWLIKLGYKETLIDYPLHEVHLHYA